MAAFIRAVRRTPRSILSSHTQTFRVVMAELGQSEQRTNLGIGILEQTSCGVKEGQN